MKTGKTAVMAGVILSLLTPPLFANDIDSSGSSSTAAQTAPADELLEQLIEEARQAMAQGQYGRAVQIYTKLLELPDHKYSADALEYLGVARERRGQMAHAKQIYQRYLQRYPDTPGAARVQQRLTALITAQQAPQKKLRETQTAREEQAWQIYGGLSQYYRHDLLKQGGETTTTVSLLSTQLDHNARLRSGESEIRTRFTGGYDHNFLDGSDNHLEISSLYVDGHDFHSGLSARIGRQRQSSGGVLGRFDGIAAAYQVAPHYRLNVVGGFPLESSALSGVDTSKHFYGLSVDADIVADVLDASAYIIEQNNEAMVERRAIGMELRYYTAQRIAVALIDYDLFFGDLNTLLAMGTWNVDDDLSLHATLDLRNSPILTTANALIGQTAHDIPELLQSYSRDQVKQLARDRTAKSHSYTVGATRSISEDVQLSADITISSLSETPASGGVEAMPGTGSDSYLSFDVMVNDLFIRDDFSILTLRRSDTSTTLTHSAIINTRLPISQSLRLNPRLRIDISDYKSDKSREISYAPSLRINHRWKRRYHFEGEFGWESAEREISSTLTERQEGYYMNIGYRMDL